MRVLAAMSGGVDSSVAAARALQAGHEVVGVTLRLWDNPTDAGCCSVAEIDDARRVANVLGIDHLVWTFTEEFESQVVSPYVAAHAEGRTPNPCVECNRHLKFGHLIRRAVQLGFDAVATGHHARVDRGADGRGPYRLRRGADAAKDQSYVLYVLGQDQLSRCLFPVGETTKAEVRREAATLGLPTATKPDSQDVCFVTTSGGRAELLGSRIPLHPGRVLDIDGAEIGRVDAVELVTVGQRRGLGVGGPVLASTLRVRPPRASEDPASPPAPPLIPAPRRYALAVDPITGTVVAGTAADLLVDTVDLSDMSWVGGRVEAEVRVDVQSSAHGHPAAATTRHLGDGSALVVEFDRPHTRVAPGQSVVLYRDDEVLGGGIAQ